MVIGISKSNIFIEDYEIIISDRDRHGGGVARYVRSDMAKTFSTDIGDIFLDILLPNSKPILIRNSL